MHRKLGLGVALLCIALISSLLMSAPLASSSPRGAPAPKIAAVGDIACKNPPGNNRSVCQYDDVAGSIAARDYDRFLPLGDIQYEYGEYENFVENYDVYFGSLLDTTSPATGNHEYGTTDAAGYFRYFGDRAPGPYYSYDLGSWHLVSLDTTICGAGGVDCRPGSTQYEWLEADLAAHPSECTLAYWHHPRWDWLKYQNADWANDYELRRSAPLYRLLYENEADVLLVGHNHNYSRWMPADPRGRFDPKHGITQYVVGTGGRNLNGFGNFHTRPGIFVRGQADAFGFLELRLRTGAWDFRWISARGQPDFIDQGSGDCH